VIDADAITALQLQSTSNAIFTPHQREFETLLKNSKLTEKNYQKNLGNNIIIRKGPIDSIISREKSATNATGNAGMTVSGTGDVLAGITAGILAQTNDPWYAATKAVKLAGEIGDKLYKKYHYGFTASDMLDYIKL